MPCSIVIILFEGLPLKPLHIFGLILLLAFNLPACSFRPSDRQMPLTVFAAASLTGPFEAITQVYEDQYPGVKVSLVFAGSQQLATQLREGARADVFSSANQVQMESVISAGLADSTEVMAFSSSRLVVIVPNDNPAGIQELQDLARSGYRLVLAAVEVPVGQYSLDFLAKASDNGEFGVDFQDQVLSNVVSYENNVKTVLAKVVLGEADAGIVYSSDVGPELLGKVSRIEIPDRLNITAVYQIVKLYESSQPYLADAFIQLVLSEQGQAILAEHGFLPVAP